MVDSISDQPLPGPEAEQNTCEDHIALIYETAEERLAAITPLIKVGLEKGELCLYISNEENDQGIVEALKAEHIDVEKAVGAGGLILTSKKEIYFKLGRFDPDWTIRVINNIADLAKSYGFTAMRIMSEMTWTREQVPGVERWPEYEAKMNALNPGISLRIICQYDRNAFPPEAMMAAIKTHPKVVSQGAVSKNSFYIPAERLLQGDHAALELERMLDTIRMSNHSEAELQNRDQLIEQMRQVVDSNSAARRTAELALDDARRRFNEFAERASDWAWELDESGHYTYSSPRVRDILGLQPEEIIGRSPLDLVSQEEADRVSAILTRTMASRAPITALEKEVRHKDGHAVFLEMNGTPVFDRDGGFRGYRGIDRDITGRKTAKQAIDESRRRAEESVAEVQARDQRIQGLEVAIAQLREAQAERDAAVASIQEALKASQADLVSAGEDLGRLRDALLAREEEAAQAKAAVEAKQAEVDAQKASLTLLQQNLMDKEVELSAMKGELEQAKAQRSENEASLGEITASYKTQALELIAARGSLTGMEESLNRKEEELVTLRQQMDRMEAELKEAKQAFASKASELAQAQGQVAQLNQALEQRSGELARKDDEIKAKELSLAEALATVGALQATLASREVELGAKVEELASKQEEARQAAEGLATVKAELEAKQAALAQTIALSEAAKADLAAQSEEASQARDARDLLEREKEQLARLVEERDGDLAEQRAAIERLTGEIEAREGEVQSLRARVADQEQALSQHLALAEKRGAELRLKEEELAAAVARSSTSDGDMAALRSKAEQLRLDLLVQEAVTLGLREALGRKDAEMEGQAKAAEDALRALRSQVDGLRAEARSRDELAAELCAVRELLAHRDAELAAKRQALSDSNDRFQAIFEQAGSGIARIDLDGRILEANDRFFSLLGYEPYELVGKSYRDIAHRDDLGQSAATHQRLVVGEIGSASVMTRYRRKLGSVVWANVTMSTVRDARGNLRYIMAIIDDRTDQMLAEIALKEKGERESEERYKDVIENAPEGVWVLDSEGKTTFVNQRVAAMLGYTPEEVAGKPASHFMNAQWRERQEADPDALGNEVRLVRKDGTDLWVTVSSMPILDQAGQSKGAIGLVTDITALKTKESLAEASRDAAVKEAARLRAVLGAIESPFLVVDANGRVAVASPALEQLLGAAVEGRPVSEAMPSLDLAAPATVKLQAGGREVELRATPSALEAGYGTLVNFQEVAPAVESAGKDGLCPRSASLAHDLNDSLTVIMGSVSLAKEYVIPEGRMYSKLKQIESASVTARDLAGQLMATAKVGAAGEPPAPAALVKGRGKVLLMDDDESILEATGDLLRYLGYTVDVARDGGEALAMCREARESKQPFDLAILDLEIGSGMGGREAGPKLAAENPGLRLIVSSGYVADPALSDFAALGFAAAIPKPYAAVVLSKVVAEVLARGK